jgi:hypothetical protein
VTRRDAFSVNGPLFIIQKYYIWRCHLFHYMFFSKPQTPLDVLQSLLPKEHLISVHYVCYNIYNGMIERSFEIIFINTYIFFLLLSFLYIRNDFPISYIFVHDRDYFYYHYFYKKRKIFVTLFKC